MLTAADLQRYKEQNPIKYKQKFGDKTIAEILGQMSSPVQTEVKSEFVAKKEIEVPLEAPKKRGRRKSNE